MSVAVQIVIVMTLLTVAPSLILLMTSFTRIVIVLGFVRTAIGVLFVALFSIGALHFFRELAGFVGDFALPLGQILHVAAVRGLPLQLTLFIDELRDPADLFLETCPLVLQSLLSLFGQQ